jgi:hypothetical protein
VLFIGSSTQVIPEEGDDHSGEERGNSSCTLHPG